MDGTEHLPDDLPGYNFTSLTVDPFIQANLDIMVSNEPSIYPNNLIPIDRVLGCNGGTGVVTIYRQTSDAWLKDDDGPWSP